jgi:hypothetical protein
MCFVADVQREAHQVWQLKLEEGVVWCVKCLQLPMLL